MARAATTAAATPSTSSYGGLVQSADDDDDEIKCGFAKRKLSSGRLPLAPSGQRRKAQVRDCVPHERPPAERQQRVSHLASLSDFSERAVLQPQLLGAGYLPRLPTSRQLIWRLARKCRLLNLTVSAPLFGRPDYLVPWGDEMRWPGGPGGLAVLCRRSSQAEDGVPF